MSKGMVLIDRFIGFFHSNQCNDGSQRVHSRMNGLGYHSDRSYHYSYNKFDNYKADIGYYRKQSDVRFPPIFSASLISEDSYKLTKSSQRFIYHL